MNKKQKHKREKETRHHTQDAAHCAVLREQVGANINKQKESDEPANKRRSFCGWLRYHSAAIVALFTGILAVVGFLQWRIYSNQLGLSGQQFTYMRKNERPWLKVQLPNQSFPPLPPSRDEIGKPVAFTLEYSNVGKTPIKNINAAMFVEIVDHDKEPSLVDPKDGVKGRAFHAVVIGFMFPNDRPEAVPITRIKTIDGQSTQENVLTEDEWQGLHDGTKFFVVWGVANYWDTHGIHHWTSFCDWHSYGAIQVNGMTCTRYNDADEN